ncbi:energy transducer TonB [Undibacterium sp.]|uniref:energy transducer TonB family protein n=1 Tax=Undibacterium sp. TaxID=1914977 RepID=UPI003753E59D
MNSTLRQLLMIFSLFLTACGAPKTETPKSDASVEKPKLPEKIPSKPDQLAIVKSNAKTLVDYQLELANHLSRVNAAKIYTGNPQALLRSVIVLRFTLNSQGNLLNKVIVRSNKDRETETIALSSLAKAQPFPVPPAIFLKQGKLDIVETWLFNSDGRFQLRTVALPQASQ